MAEYKHSHPYAKYEDHPNWKTMTRAVADMKRNDDIEVTTDETYVVGYLCEQLAEAKTGPTTVYVSGPYTKGDPCINTNVAIKAGNQLLDLGYVPFVPHLSHFWHTVTPRPYDDWMKIDLAFLPACKALLRLPGESKGAEIEVAAAIKLCIPVFHSIEELKKNVQP